MTKIKVITRFKDKFNMAHFFNVGGVVDFEDERAKDVISRGLAEPYVEPKKVAEAPKADEAEAAKEGLTDEKQIAKANAKAEKAADALAKAEEALKVAQDELEALKGGE